MAPGIRRFWPAGLPSVSGGRAARQGFYYDAFAGWEIARTEPDLSAETIQDLVRAESAIRRLNEDPPRSESLESLAHQLLRSEAVASSRIEGLEVSHKVLAEAAFDPKLATANAASVLGNVKAMQEGLKLGSGPTPITVDTLIRIHARLFKGARDEAIAGRLRASQNWIGSGDNPYRAVFVPVPEDDVPRLLQDLVAFIARDDLAPLAQAAVAHAQFETIHPFGDGNGRVGRILVHLILRRRGLAPHYVPPISLVLAANDEAYVAGLTAYREHRDNEWMGLFSRAAGIAADGARGLAADIETLKARWRERAKPRAGSAAAKLIDVLPLHPVFDLRSASDFLRVSDEAARLGIARLEDAGILREVTKRKWGRAWEAAGLFALLDGFERKLATPQDAPRRRAAPRDAGPSHIAVRSSSKNRPP
ncbi:MAG: Fic family protein [Chloroflexota bacterium]|nr:Fic family protein [Chloroflexota bacterium]